MEVKDLFEKALADEEYHLTLNECGECEEFLYLVDKAQESKISRTIISSVYFGYLVGKGKWRK